MSCPLREEEPQSLNPSVGEALLEVLEESADIPHGGADPLDELPLAHRGKKA